jgi:membrane-associated phospholipid phosphatase
MLFATIVIGGHYLVDIIGGVAIAISAIALSTKMAKKLAPTHI